MLYVTFTLEILVLLGLPVGLWLLLRRRPGATWGLIGAGGLAFIAAQAVHLPLMGVLGLLTGGFPWGVPLMALVGGLAAGLCENVARYLVLRLWRREARSYDEGVAFGAGHGGVESILLGTLVAVNFATMAVMRGGDLGALGLAGQELEQAQAQLNAYWSMPWYLPLVGALERVFAIALQIALSLLVLRALTHDNLGWLGVAVFVHALADGLAAWAAQVGWSVVAIEGVLTVFALGSIALIVALRPGGARASPVSRETLT